MVTLLLLAGLAMSPDVEPPPKYKVRIENHEIWIDTDGGPRRVTYDAAASYPIAVSQSGDKLAFAVPGGKSISEGSKPPMQVVIMSSAGQSLSKFSPEDPYFDSLEWIDEERIGVMTSGHANCIYRVVDSNTGRTLHEYWGGFDFVWSHDRQHVARRALGPITRTDDKGASFESDDLSSLSFDDEDKEAYPPEDPKTGRPYERILGYLTWSPDDKWISFPETENPSGDSYVVLVSPQGEVLRESLPVDTEYNAKIVWTDDTHFKISASKRTFYFVVENGKLREITAPALH